jgi:hypothetical protein
MGSKGTCRLMVAARIAFLILFPCPQKKSLPPFLYMKSERVLVALACTSKIGICNFIFKNKKFIFKHKKFISRVLAK